MLRSQGWGSLLHHIGGTKQLVGNFIRVDGIFKSFLQTTGAILPTLVQCQESDLNIKWIFTTPFLRCDDALYNCPACLPGGLTVPHQLDHHCTACRSYHFFPLSSGRSCTNLIIYIKPRTYDRRIAHTTLHFVGHSAGGAGA